MSGIRLTRRFMTNCITPIWRIICCRRIATEALFWCNNLVCANERYVLLKNYRGSNWVLADVLNGKIKDLTDVLLSEDNKKPFISQEYAAVKRK